MRSSRMLAYSLANGARGSHHRIRLGDKYRRHSCTRPCIVVAENPTLGQQELNTAFGLMQYFGYLRRNPNDPPKAGLDFAGYNFWLGKLNQFNGNFVNAEMVKACIVSSEYRQRFGT